MATDNELQLKNGLEADRKAITPIQGEPLWATDTKKLFVGDGATPGGIPIGIVHKGITPPVDTLGDDGDLFFEYTGNPGIPEKLPLVSIPINSTPSATNSINIYTSAIEFGASPTIKVDIKGKSFSIYGYIGDSDSSITFTPKIPTNIDALDGLSLSLSGISNQLTGVKKSATPAGPGGRPAIPANIEYAISDGDSHILFNILVNGDGTSTGTPTGKILTMSIGGSPASKDQGTYSLYQKIKGHWVDRTLKLLTTSIVKTVASITSSGADFPNFHEAMLWASEQVCVNNGEITLVLDEGEHLIGNISYLEGLHEANIEQNIKEPSYYTINGQTINISAHPEGSPGESGGPLIGATIIRMPTYTEAEYLKYNDKNGDPGEGGLRVNWFSIISGYLNIENVQFNMVPKAVSNTDKFTNVQYQTGNFLTQHSGNVTITRCKINNFATGLIAYSDGCTLDGCKFYNINDLKNLTGLLSYPGGPPTTELKNVSNNKGIIQARKNATIFVYHMTGPTGHFDLQHSFIDDTPLAGSGSTYSIPGAKLSSYTYLGSPSDEMYMADMPAFYPQFNDLQPNGSLITDSELDPHGHINPTTKSVSFNKDELGRRIVGNLVRNNSLFMVEEPTGTFVLKWKDNTNNSLTMSNMASGTAKHTDENHYGSVYTITMVKDATQATETDQVP